MLNNEDTKQDLELRYIRRDLEALQNTVQNGFTNIALQIKNDVVTRHEFELRIGVIEKARDRMTTLLYSSLATTVALIIKQLYDALNK
jgi:BMFP domain-containing protein YqiC